MYKWDFQVLEQYWRVFFEGIITTFVLSIEVIATALVASIFLAAFRISRVSILEWVGVAFVELFRNVPPLILLIWIYYCVPVLTGWQANPHLAAYVALSLYATAYTSEIIRAGLQSIGMGQWEAGRSIGLMPPAVFRYVILPQAMKRMVPALINQGIETVKTTTLASTIAFAELLYNTKLISDIESRPLETYTVACAMFIVTLSLLSWVLLRLSTLTLGRN